MAKIAKPKMSKPEPIRNATSHPEPLLCWIVALFAPIVMAQGRAAASSGDAATFASSHLAAPDPSSPNPSDLLREIDDAALGRRWLLYRDPRHPEGPGRLVAVSESAPGRAHAASPLSRASSAALRPVIRAGDRVILEEHSPIVDARLEAIALVPAAQGSPLKVRLVLGGKIVQGVAIAPGRVGLAPQPESLP